MIKAKEKKNRFATYHKISYSKPTWNTCVRHRWQRQFIGFRFLIVLLKEATESTFFISTGTSSQILGARFRSISNRFHRPRMKLSFTSCVIRGILIEWKDFLHYLWWKSIHYFIQLSCKNLNISMVHWNRIISTSKFFKRWCFDSIGFYCLAFYYATSKLVGSS